jgi:hypothetical protein
MEFPTSPDTMTFWAVVAAGWVTGIAFIFFWMLRGVLREWWDFRAWYRAQKNAQRE